MNTPETILEVLTLGRFSLSVNGEPVATEWPDETLKVFFCSLLSPLDLYFAWDRICRSMLDVPVSRISRRRLEQTIIRPLNVFLIKELGFNPLISGPEGIRIDQHKIHVDAHEFYINVLEGLRLLSVDNSSEAIEKFSKANALYAGSYLTGIPGKIIENTRHDLEALYRSTVMEGIWHTRTTLHARTTRLAPPLVYKVA